MMSAHSFAEGALAPRERMLASPDETLPVSAVRRATLACAEGVLASSNGKCSARLVFPPEYIGFQGHFPDDPILPGVCLIDAALAVFERAEQRPVRLNAVASAKFRDPVRPGQAILIECASSPAERGLRVAVQVSCAGKRIAELVLVVTPSDPLE